jgi:hypothetical protein
MLFTKGLAETMKMNVNPDTMNFYIRIQGYQYHQILNGDTNGFGCLILCLKYYFPKIKFVAGIITARYSRRIIFFTLLR